ncbi:hypothetical protein [Paralcaligenes ginsengisoli]
MKSIAQQIELVSGLTDTTDLSQWENEFVKSVYVQFQQAGKITTSLSGKQVEIIDRIYSKNFG